MDNLSCDIASSSKYLERKNATLEWIYPALLRPLLIPLTSKKWTACTGIGGRHPPDSVDDMNRNQWPPCSGIRIKDQNGRQALKELESLAEQTIENLRRLTRALRPIYLEDLGLVTALEMLAREISQNNHPVVNFQKTGQERRLSREVELSLYRIAQEALSNVSKHSKASRADLMITFEAAEIKIEVNDNGNGFVVPKSPTEFAPSGHFGLLGMHERADLIGARLEIESTLGKGTRLTVRL
jgi:signal transduction histidine kinase